MPDPEDGLDAFEEELDGLDPESFSLGALLKAQHETVLARLQAIEPVINHFELLYSVVEPNSGGWQSFHNSKLNDGDARLLIARNGEKDASTTHVIINNETRDATVHVHDLQYWEFAFSNNWRKCSTRYGNAIRRDPAMWGADGNLGKCALLASNADEFTVHRLAGSLLRPQAIPKDLNAIGHTAVRLKVLLPILESFTDGMHFTAATGTLK